MTTPNRTVLQAQDAQTILGVQKHLLTLSSLPLAGTSLTPTELVARIQARIDAVNQVNAARAQWLDLVRAEDAVSEGLTPILRGLRQFLLNTHGEAKAPLADFGMSPPRKRVLTPEAKVAAAAKGRATRKARHTMGKVQKKDVKGTVETTVTAPATPVPATTTK